MIATAAAFKISAALNDWIKTSSGASAVAFCTSLGIKNNADVYSGCLEDMRVTKSEAIAKESAVSAMEFAAKNRVASPSKRFCVASGDPHCTNYDGDFFHIQEPGIYTIAASRDGVFELQEKMRKNGANNVGVPSCMTGALVRYKQMTIEADVADFGKIRVNGAELNLKRDETVTYGGVSIRYGKQTVEWRSAESSAVGLKLSTPEGFGVLITGGYCGVLETSVPTSHYGQMGGICGNADGAQNAADYFSPSGEIMNVNRGAKQWEMAGYNGPNSPLSKWQLAWKPIGSRCYFAMGCEAGPAVLTRVVPKVVPKVAPKVVAQTVVPNILTKVVPKVAPKVVAPNILTKVVPNVIKSVVPKIIASAVVPKVVTNVVTNVVAKAKENGFKVYGNYCGPNYCGGQKFKGAEGPNCRWGIPPKDNLDSCCKVHDQCCGTVTTRGVNCNQAILSCLEKVKCSDPTCRFSQELMKITFTGMKNKVCGELFSKKKSTTVSKVVSTNPEPKSSIVRSSPVNVVSSRSSPAAPSPTVARPSPSPSVRTKETVIDEIMKAKTKATTKFTKFQQKLLDLLKENSDDQVKIETENRNNFDGVSDTLQNEKLRLESARVSMKKIYDETQSLNITIQKHYKKMIADTDYLQSLDAMRPTFLKSLDDLAIHIQNVKSVVDTKIIKDEYKDEMVRLLTGIHFNTHNISGYVATAFINHYNKYRSMIRQENVDYSSELKRLTTLSNEYKIQIQKTADIEKERVRLQGILSKLKDTLTLSVTQGEEFDVLVKDIVSIFDRGCSGGSVGGSAPPRR